MLAPPKPPSYDELEALIKEARARQLRRRLLGAAAVATLAAIGLGSYALTSGGRGSAATSSSAGPAPPLCRSAQLSTSAGATAAAGTALLSVTMANTSRACTLPNGRPDVRILFRAKQVPIKQQSWSAQSDFGRPAGGVLAPGRRAYVDLRWRDWCPHPAAAPTTGRVTLVLRFHDGLRVTAPESAPDVPGPALPACGEVAGPQPVGVSRLLR